MTASTLIVSSINGALPGTGSGSGTSTWLTGTGGIIYYNSGNVGIGTSANISNFQVYGATNPNITLGNSTYPSDFQIGMASAGGNYSGSAIAGDTIIRTISGNLMLQAMGGGNAAIYLSRTNNYVGVGMATPSNLLTVAQLGTNYTSPVVVVDAGIPGNATAGAPRGMGKPLLGIGNSSWTSGGVAGDYYGIGFGYGGAASGSYYPAEIGLYVQTTSGSTWGDIVFSARGVTSATAAVERMRITGGGNVGIGISNPTYLLHVSSITSTYTLTSYLGSGGIGSWGGGSIENITSLFITGWGMTQAAWGVTSDKRVKTNIEPVSNMLSIIQQVNVVKYDYIDPRLGREECSVIAQELQAVFPNAINVTTDYVPNIFKRCSHVQNDNIVTLSVTLESTPEHLAAITVGSTLKMMISDDGGETEREMTTPILAVSFTDHMIQVSMWENYRDTSIVYLYGTEVKDYLSVDKPQLGVMALQGVKELMSENEQLKSQVATLQAANAATSSQVATLHGTCATLQAANAATSSQMAALMAWARTQGFS